MAEKKVTIKINADGKKAESVLSSLTEKVNKIGNSKTVKGVANLGLAFGGVTAAAQVVTKAIGAAVAALNECAEAYKTQAKAETQLAAAAKNNPYLNDSSVRALKAYAGELQSISAVGDEKLLPLMAQLASAGRTQAEIQSIMSAALDASASGAISLEAAVKGLNASYSGQAGQLSRILPQVKGLTAEELKQGKAVQVVADSYKGMAQEVAKSVGASEQLANAWGDFKESLGQGWEEATAPAKRELAGLLGQINAINAKKKEIKGAESNIAGGTASEVDYEIKIEEVTQQLAGARAELEAVQQTINSGMGGIDTAYALAEAQKRVGLLAAELGSYTKLKERLASIAREEAEAAEKARAEAEKRKAAEEAMAAANKKAGDAVDAYNKAIEDAQRKIDARRSLGEEITEQEERQTMLEARKSAYLNMISQAQGTISGKLEREIKAREEIARLAAEIASYDQSGEGLADKFAKKNQPEVSWEEQKKELEGARAAINEWHKEVVSDASIATDQKKALEKKYKDAVEQINREIAEGERQTNEERFKSFQNVFNQIGGYVQQSAQLIHDAILEEKYRKGEIAEQEYNDRKVQIEKEAAQKEYKVKMWEWAANIAQATANVAMAAIGAAAQTSGNAVARIIAMSLIGAAAGVQMASLIASKPVPPSFATGGIVQGSSWSGDNVRANVNSGEMILNAAQQKALWETANGRGASGGGMSVIINNSAANVVNAQPRISRGQIEIMIDARVKEGLSSGKYNSALEQANQTMDGTFYGV